MPRFYFDFDDGGGGSILDNEGEELPDVDAAQREALAALGNVAREYTRHSADGRVSVRVRDDQGAVLQVSATFETKPIRR